MNEPRNLDFFKLWRWTIAIFSFVLVNCYWALLFSSSIWGTKFRYAYLFRGSLPVIALLFLTVLLSLRRRRRYAAFGFAICIAWLVWAALPRL
jgi:drug/metabolite transporter (DMT)-like permease